MSRFLKFAAVLAALALVAGPASATHTLPGEEFVPEYVETPVYLHCNGDNKVNNVTATQPGTLVTWDGTKPTASYQSGAGCGTLDTFAEGTTDANPIYDFPFRGTYTGNIDNITVRLWAIEAAGSRHFNEFTVDLHLTIDGEPILTRPTEAHATPIASSTGATRLYEVTVTNVGLADELAHATEHEVAVTVYSKYIDGSGINAWVYDAAEIDSGLIFNDTTPAATLVPRNS